ncbi:MAG: hypothetical protein WHS89_05365 [Acidimicrobiales bacterium]
MRRRHQLRDRGAGLIGAMAGITVFLAFLLFAVQLLMNLHTTSMVSSAAYEAARVAAGASVDPTDGASVAAGRQRGEQRARTLLGRYGEQVQFDWSASTADTVVLRVRASSPRFTLGGLPARLGFDDIDRTVRVRMEELR